jgi:hypothetical protein
MTWHPPFGPLLTTGLTLLVLAVIVTSFLVCRHQLKASNPAALMSMILRCLGFLLLLFFVLQPSVLPEPQKIVSKRTLAVLVDTSGSMSQNDVPDGASDPSLAELPTRLEQVLRLIRAQRVFEQVTAEAKLAVYRFDGQATPIKADALDKLDATGKLTDLAAAIRQVENQHQRDDLAGLLLFTDGRNTQGADAREAAKRARAPLFIMPIGRKHQAEWVDPQLLRKDLAVEAVSADRRLILGRSAQVVASVSAIGYGARQFDVQLLKQDELVNSSSVTISATQTKRQAIFTVKPEEVGTHTYQIKIPAEEDEADPTNNLKSVTIEVVDPVNRLLYLDRLRNEQKFLKRVIAAHRNLRYTTVVRMDAQRLLVQGNDAQMKAQAGTLTAEQLSGLKTLIIGDLRAEALGAAKIAALSAWVDSGGALLLLGGPRSLGAAGFASTKLAQLLPVSFAAGQNYVEQEYHVALTAEGAAHPAFQRIAKRWAPSTPLLSLVKMQAVKPAATVLLAQRNDPQAPIAVSHRFGRGKVAVILTDSTWRWQLGAKTRRSGQRSEHAVFWQQVIDWLLPELTQSDSDAAQVQLITDRIDYEVNEQVVLIATVRGDDGQVPKNVKVQFNVATPDGRPIKRNGKLEVAEAVAASAFTASFEAYAPGEYAIQAIATIDGRTLGTDHTQIQVVQPVIEFIQTDPDHDLLREMAQLSEGRYLQPDDLTRLAHLAKLQPREKLLQPNAEEDSDPAWNHWPLMAIFIALMSAEWLIRRRNQWV